MWVLNGTFVLLVAPSDLLDSVLEEDSTGDVTRAEGMICGAVKQLRASRGRCDSAVYLALMSLAKARPGLFMRTRILDVMLAFVDCTCICRSVSLSVVLPACLSVNIIFLKLE